MSKKRKGTGIENELSNLKIKKRDKEALGIFAIHHTYKPYSIKNRMVKGWNTQHKNEEKSRELLDYLLDMGNSTTFKAKTDKDVEDAIDTIIERDHNWAKQLLSGQLKIEDLGTIAIPEVFLSKVPFFF